MKRLRKLSHPSAFVPTTAMADIAFLLVVFFMVSAEFSVRKGLVFKLPAESEQSEVADEARAIVLALDAGGRLSVDGIPSDLLDIRRVITPKLEASPNQWILLRAHAETQYGSVIEVLDQVKQLGAKNIAVPSRAEFAAWDQNPGAVPGPGARR